jgi:catechol 2,3-dioxygenase-like lactoylglutathione lyase family enzyme
MRGHFATPRVRVGSVVIRCHRFDEMVAFWSEALGYVPREEPEDDWAVLTDPAGGGGPNLSLARVDEPMAPPLDLDSAIHLDLYTTDAAAEVDRLVSLGARRYAHAAPDTADFVVLVDPDGYRFCVVQKDSPAE